MKLKCLAVDDEQPALNVLTKFIAKTPFLELVLSTCNAVEALAFLKKESVDLLFVDIQMPDMTGVQLVQQLKTHHLSQGDDNAKVPMIIFTTAYENYALEGFELEVLDYLLKPIPFERFLKAANKALGQYELLQGKIQLPDVQEFLFVKSDYQIKKIKLDDILYIEGLKDYVKIYTTKGMILSRQNIKGITSKLPSSTFIRIHKSYVVSFPKVEAFQKSGLYIEGQRLPIGEYYRETILKLIGSV